MYQITFLCITSSNLQYYVDIYIINSNFNVEITLTFYETTPNFLVFGIFHQIQLQMIKFRLIAKHYLDYVRSIGI